MPHTPSSYNRLRELEQSRHMSRPSRNLPTQDYQRRYPANTLGPNEELLDRRRGQRRKHVAITNSAPRQRNILLENIFILIFLAASIWGLYNLIIYLLTHN